MDESEQSFMHFIRTWFYLSEYWNYEAQMNYVFLTRIRLAPKQIADNKFLK